MSMPNGNHAIGEQRQGGRMISRVRDLWDRATRAASANRDEARREYMTKAVCLAVSTSGCIFTIIFFICWLLNLVPGDSSVILGGLTVILMGGWLLAMFGYWRITAYVPTVLTFAIALYGNIIGGEGAPSLAVFALAITMTALLLGHRATWGVSLLSIAAYAILAIARINGLIYSSRSLEMFLVNRITVVASANIGMAILLWFLVRRYRAALDESDRTASLLSEHAEKVSEINLKLEVENAERRRVQHALQESEERYRSLVNNIPDIVYAINGKGEILSVNEESLKIFGYRAEEVQGRLFMEMIHPDDVHTPYDAFLSMLRDRREYTSGLQYRILDRSGVSHWVEAHSHARFDEEGRFIGEEGVLRDITERKLAEDRTSASLREKEVLLREIHHRVKNNFQIITSLLNLQSRNITDPELMKLFEDSTTRIRAMALVHEKLYQSSDLSEIDFSSYLKTIAEDLSDSYRGIIRRPRLVLDAGEAFLGVDQAVPCGLIANELITNALKYAFVDGSADNAISIMLRRDAGGMVTIRISDNGVGLPAGLDPEHTQTLGLQLVSLLAKQIHGTVKLERQGGTTWTISFPASHQDRRT
jgi:PAS domain S-box-containing protein